LKRHIKYYFNSDREGATPTPYVLQKSAEAIDGEGVRLDSFVYGK